jgi:enoyl-[acyl-carrier-protein] reductase (NADH)
MLRQKSGSIVKVSTTVVDQPIAGLGAAVQIMVKGGLNAVTRALAIEYAKEGIRINTIAAGVIDTPMHRPETHDFLKGLQPVGRIGEVREVVDAALFLTDATFTSGEILHVDGGAHADAQPHEIGREHPIAVLNKHLTFTDQLFRIGSIEHDISGLQPPSHKFFISKFYILEV